MVLGCQAVGQGILISYPDWLGRDAKTLLALITVLSSFVSKGHQLLPSIMLDDTFIKIAAAVSGL